MQTISQIFYILLHISQHSCINQAGSGYNIKSNFCWKERHAPPYAILFTLYDVFACLFWGNRFLLDKRWSSTFYYRAKWLQELRTNPFEKRDGNRAKISERIYWVMRKGSPTSIFFFQEISICLHVPHFLWFTNNFPSIILSTKSRPQETTKCRQLKAPTETTVNLWFGCRVLVVSRKYIAYLSQSVVWQYHWVVKNIFHTQPTTNKKKSLLNWFWCNASEWSQKANQDWEDI